MAKGFNLTAQINLAGPTNLKPIVAQIRRELGTIQSNVQVKLDTRSTKSISGVTNRLKAMNDILVTAKSNTDSLNASLASLSSSLSAVSNNGGKVSISVRNTASGAAEAAKNIKQASTEMQEFGKQAYLAIRRFAAFSIVSTTVFKLVNAVNSGIAAFVNFDKELVKLQQVTGQGATGLKSLEKTITQLSTSLGVSSESLINVASTLAQAGLNAEETRVALSALAKTELAPSFDNLTDTTEGAIAALRQFELQAGDLESALGSINAVAAAFAVESRDIITAIQRTGGVFAASSKGISQGKDALNEFIAVFTSVRQTTRESAETIATGLRTIFTRIQRGSTIQALKDFGITLTDLEGKFVGPFEAIKRLSEGLKSLDPRDLRFSQIVEELGGFRQIGKVIPLIQQFAVAQKALGIAQTGQTSLTDAQIVAQQSLANQIAKVREQFLALFRDIGQTKTFQVITRGILGLTSAFLSLASAFKPILPVLAVLATIKGVKALGEFGTGFFGSFQKGGGAKSAGTNIGGILTGTTEKETKDVTGKASEAIRDNTSAIKSLTTSINSLATIINTKPTGLNTGGIVRGFATGGMVPGSGNRDTVPAVLTPGEFVIRKKAVEAIGADNLQKMNKYALGGPVKSTQLKSVEIKKRVKSANSNIDPEDFKSGKYLTDTDLIYFDKYEYGLKAPKNIRFDTFEDQVGQKIKGKPVGGKLPIDIPKNKFNIPIEVRNRNETTQNSELLDKLLRYNLLTNKTLISNKKQKDNNLYAGQIGVAYNTSKIQRDRFIELNSGGKIQKFMSGGIAKAILSNVTKEPNPADLIGGPFAANKPEAKNWLALLNGIIRSYGIPYDNNKQTISVGGASVSLRDVLSPRTLGAANFAKKIGQNNIAKLQSLREEIVKKYIEGRTQVSLEDPFNLSDDEKSIAREVAVVGLQSGFASTNRQFFKRVGGLPLSVQVGSLTSDKDILTRLRARDYANLQQAATELLPGKTIQNLTDKELEELGRGNAEGYDLEVILKMLGATGGISSERGRAVDFEGGLPSDLAKLFGVRSGIFTQAKRTLTSDSVSDALVGIAARLSGSRMAFGGKVDQQSFEDIRKQIIDKYPQIDFKISKRKSGRGFGYNLLGALKDDGGLLKSKGLQFEQPRNLQQLVETADKITNNLLNPQQFTLGGSPEDTVPALLTPGEFVINKKAAKRIGYSRLHQMNRADKVQGYNSGGAVGNIQKFAGGGLTKDEQDFIDYRARKAGTSTKSFTYDLAGDVARTATSLQRDYSGRKQEFKYGMTQEREKLKGLDLKTVGGQNAFAEAVAEMAKKVQSFNPEMTFDEAKQAAEKLAQGLLDGKKSNDELIQQNTTLKNIMDKELSATEALTQARIQVAKQQNIEVGILDKAVNSNEIKRQQFIQSEEGKQFGNLSLLVPDMAKKFSASATGGALMKGSDFLSGRGGRLSKLVGGMGGIGGIGAALAVGSEGLKSLLPKSMTTNANVAGSFGAISGAGAGAATGAMLGAQIAGPVGAMVAGIGGAVIGGIQGFFNAKNTQILTNALESVAQSSSALDTAFKKLETDSNNINFQATQKAFSDVISSQKDIIDLSMAQPATLTGAGTSGAALAGAGAGALIGSFFGPGIGTVIGAGVGYLGGATLDYLSKPSESVRKEAMQSRISQASTNQATASRLAETQLKRTSTAELDKIFQSLKDGTTSLDPITKQYVDSTIKSAEATGKYTKAQLDAIAASAEEESYRQAYIKSLKDSGASNDEVQKQLTENNDKVIAEGKKITQANTLLISKQEILARITKEVAVATESLLDVYERIGAALTRFSSNTDSIIANLENIINPTKIAKINRNKTEEAILSNPLGFKPEEVTSAIDSIVNKLGGGEKATELGQQAKAASVLQRQLPALMRSPGATTEQVTNLARSQLTTILGEKNPIIGTIMGELENKLGQDKEGGLATLAGEIESSGLGQISATAAKALETLRESAKTYNDTLDRSIELENQWVQSMSNMVESNRKANQIRVQSELDLRRTFGQQISLQDLNQPFESDIRGLTGGPIDVAGIADQRQQALDEGKRLQTERENLIANQASQDELNKNSEALRKNKLRIDNLDKALSALGNSADRANNALTKIGERQQRLQEFGQGFRGLFTGGVENRIEAIRQFRAVSTGRQALASGQTSIFGNQMFLQSFEQGLDRLKDIIDPTIYKDLILKSNIAMAEQAGFNVDEVMQGLEDTFGPQYNTLRKIFEGKPAEDDPLITEFKKYAEEQRQANIETARQQAEISNILTKEGINPLIKSLEENFPRIVQDAFDSARNNIQSAVQAAGNAQNTVGADTLARGGIVYANSGGQLVNFKPKGPDRIPAMLADGEFVVNANATKNNLGLLEAINGGKKIIQNRYANRGGVIYAANGGMVSGLSADTTIEEDKKKLNEEINAQGAAYAAGTSEDYKKDKAQYDSMMASYDEAKIREFYFTHADLNMDDMAIEYAKSPYGAYIKNWNEIAKEKQEALLAGYRAKFAQFHDEFMKEAMKDPLMHNRASAPANWPEYQKMREEAINQRREQYWKINEHEQMMESKGREDTKYNWDTKKNETTGTYYGSARTPEQRAKEEDIRRREELERDRKVIETGNTPSVGEKKITAKSGKIELVEWQPGEKEAAIAARKAEALANVNRARAAKGLPPLELPADQIDPEKAKDKALRAQQMAQNRAAREERRMASRNDSTTPQTDQQTPLTPYQARQKQRAEAYIAEKKRRQEAYNQQQQKKEDFARRTGRTTPTRSTVPQNFNRPQLSAGQKDELRRANLYGRNKETGKPNTPEEYRQQQTDAKLIRGKNLATQIGWKIDVNGESIDEANASRLESGLTSNEREELAAYQEAARTEQGRQRDAMYERRRLARVQQAEVEIQAARNVASAKVKQKQQAQAQEKAAKDAEFATKSAERRKAEEAQFQLNLSKRKEEEKRQRDKEYANYRARQDAYTKQRKNAKAAEEQRLAQEEEDKIPTVKLDPISLRPVKYDRETLVAQITQLEKELQVKKAYGETAGSGAMTSKEIEDKLYAPLTGLTYILKGIDKSTQQSLETKLAQNQTTDSRYQELEQLSRQRKLKPGRELDEYIELSLNRGIPYGEIKALPGNIAAVEDRIRSESFTPQEAKKWEKRRKQEFEMGLAEEKRTSFYSKVAGELSDLAATKAEQGLEYIDKLRGIDTTSESYDRTGNRALGNALRFAASIPLAVANPENVVSAVATGGFGPAASLAIEGTAGLAGAGIAASQGDTRGVAEAGSQVATMAATTMALQGVGRMMTGPTRGRVYSAGAPGTRSIDVSGTRMNVPGYVPKGQEKAWREAVKQSQNIRRVKVGDKYVQVPEHVPVGRETEWVDTMRKKAQAEGIAKQKTKQQQQEAADGRQLEANIERMEEQKAKILLQQAQAENAARARTAGEPVPMPPSATKWPTNEYWSDISRTGRSQPVERPIDFKEIPKETPKSVVKTAEEIRASKPAPKVSVKQAKGVQPLPPKITNISDPAQLGASIDYTTSRLSQYASSPEAAARMVSELPDKLKSNIAGVEIDPNLSIKDKLNQSGAVAVRGVRGRYSSRTKMLGFRTEQPDIPLIKHEIGYGIQDVTGQMSPLGVAEFKTKLGTDIESFLQSKEGLDKLYADLGRTGYSKENIIKEPRELFTTLLQFEDTDAFRNNPMAQDMMRKIVRTMGYKNGGLVHAATGGKIGSGPDSILARVSPNEFIMNPHDTMKNLPLLHYMNKGGKISYFEDGGQTTSSGNAIRSTGPNGNVTIAQNTNQTNNQNIPDFTKFIDSFGTYIDRLEKIQFPKIPDRIELTGNYQLQVQIQGAAALEGLDKRMKELAVSLIEPKLEELRNEVSSVTGGQVRSSASRGYKGDVNISKNIAGLG